MESPALAPCRVRSGTRGLAARPTKASPRSHRHHSFSLSSSALHRRPAPARQPLLPTLLGSDLVLLVPWPLASSERRLTLRYHAAACVVQRPHLRLQFGGGSSSRVPCGSLAARRRPAAPQPAAASLPKCPPRQWSLTYHPLHAFPSVQAMTIPRRAAALVVCLLAMATGAAQACSSSKGEGIVLRWALFASTQLLSCPQTEGIILRWAQYASTQLLSCPQPLLNRMARLPAPPTTAPCPPTLPPRLLHHGAGVRHRRRRGQV